MDLTPAEITAIELSLRVAIVATLGSALYYLYHDRGHGTRMVKALAIRVALSAALLIFLVVSYELGWIGEAGPGPSCLDPGSGASRTTSPTATARS